MLDQHGNPAGSENDLVHHGAMRGQKILLAIFLIDSRVDASPLPAALTAKGYTVKRITYPLPPRTEFEAMLDDVNQLWIWSSAEPGRLAPGHVAAIVRRWKEGRLGITLLADNTPFVQEAATVLNAIAPGSTIQGQYLGEQTLHARSGNGGGFDPASPLFHGIHAFNEGVTVSAVRGPSLVPVCYASDGSPLIATLQQTGTSRLVIDGGFTAMMQPHWSAAGSARFAVNCAGWLSGAEKRPRGSSQR